MTFTHNEKFEQLSTNLHALKGNVVQKLLFINCVINPKSPIQILTFKKSSISSEILS